MTRRRKHDAVAIEPRERLADGPDTDLPLDGVTLDFGHHAGRTIEELLRLDPDYLVWLGSHPIGARYRAEIDRTLARSGDRER